MDGRKKWSPVWFAYCFWMAAVLVFLYQLTIMALTNVWTMLHIRDLVDPVRLLWIEDISWSVLQHLLQEAVSMSLISLFILFGLVVYVLARGRELVAAR
jgi:hypothetical protein